MIKAETHEVILDSAEMLTPKVRHLRFKRKDGNAFDFVPGQFVSFHLPGPEGKEVKRSYSLATIPGKSDFIELALGYVEGGLASEILFHIKPGDVMTLSGPYGRLILREETPKRYIMVATSTGVTPYRAMLPQLSERLKNSNLSVVILLGVQHQEDGLYTEDFLAFEKEHPNFQFRLCYSRENLANPKPHEFKGYVQQYFNDLETSPENDLVYLCGNPNMIDDAFVLLKEKGFTPQQVRREKYVS